jgi:IS30 family transposase
MAKTYNHLSLKERAVMQVMLDHGCSLRAIARKLCRSASTISRELARSGGAVTDPLAPRSPGRPRTACGYRCAKAQQRAQRLDRKARVACKMVHGNALWTRVIDALRRGLSP